jgi:hypothetical protein
VSYINGNHYAYGVEYFETDSVDTFAPNFPRSWGQSPILKEGETLPPDVVDFFGFFKLSNFDYFEAITPYLPNFNGFSPRWISTSKVLNSDGSKSTAAIMLAINTKQERDIHLAPGFSQRVLGPDEMMGTKSALNFIGV